MYDYIYSVSLYTAQAPTKRQCIPTSVSVQLVQGRRQTFKHATNFYPKKEVFVQWLVYILKSRYTDFKVCIGNMPSFLFVNVVVR